MAGAALCAQGRTFAWQARHFDSPGIAGARLGAGGARLQLRGRRNTFCIWSNFCVAGAALGAHGRTFAWQAWHFDSLGIAGARLGAGGPGRRWAPAAVTWQAQHFLHLEQLLRGRCSTLCAWTYVCVAGAAL